MVTYVVIALLLLVIAFLVIKSKRKTHKAPDLVKNPNDLIGTDSGAMISQERKEENKGLSKTESFNEIIIGTSENRPYATLTVLEKDFSPGKNAKKLQMTGKAWQAMAPAIQLAPSVVTATTESASTYMKVVVNGTLARAADGNGYRGFVRDAATGKFVEHGRFYDAKTLKEVIALSVGFQAVSVLVGQAHLAAINQKLTAIQDGIDNIISFLENQRQAKIKAIFQHLSEYGMAVSNGELSESYRTSIEQIDLDLKAFFIELESEISQKTKKLKDYKDTEKFGCANLYNEIVETSEHIDKLTNLLFVCVQCRIMACQLLCYFPNTATISEIRIGQIKSDVGRITGTDGVLELAREAVLSRVYEIDSGFTKDATIEQRRDAVKRKYAELKSGVLRHQRDVAAGYADSAELLKLVNSPVEMLVKISDGKPQEAMLVSNFG